MLLHVSDELVLGGMRQVGENQVAQNQGQRKCDMLRDFHGRAKPYLEDFTLIRFHHSNR